MPADNMVQFMRVSSVSEGLWLVKKSVQTDKKSIRNPARHQTANRCRQV